MTYRAFDRGGTVARFTISCNLRHAAALHAMATELTKAYRRNFRRLYKLYQSSPAFFTVREKETGKLIMLIEKEAA